MEVYEIVEKLNNYLNGKGIGITFSEISFMICVFAIFIIIVFIPQALSYSIKLNKRAKNARLNYTSECIGTITRIEEIRHYDADKKDHFYESHAVAEFMTQYEAHASVQITSKEQYKVGDKVVIMYNPTNPKQNMFKDDVARGLNEKWYSGILNFFKTLVVFACVVLFIMIITGFFS